MRDAGLKEPGFDTESFFTVVFYKPENAIKKTREKTREKIISAIREDPIITTEKLAKICSLTIKGIEWQISKLKQEGILKRVGPDKGGHWEAREG